MNRFKIGQRRKKDELKPLSDDITIAIDLHPNVTFVETHSDYRRSIINLKDNLNTNLLGKKIDEMYYFLTQNPEIVKAIQKHPYDLIIQTWYDTQATDAELIAKGKREENVSLQSKRLAERQDQIKKYASPTFHYQEHLKLVIEKELNELKNDMLNQIYFTLNSNSPLLNENQKMYSKKILAFDLMNQYEIKAFKNSINTLLSSQPKVLVALKKLAVMNKAEKILINGINSNQSKSEIVYNYENNIRENRKVLMQRRDSGFETFVKDLGVFAATIFGVGIGGILAYKHLFGSKAVHGKQFVNEVYRKKKHKYYS